MAIAKKCDICGSFYENYNMKDSEKNPKGFMLVNLDDKKNILFIMRKTAALIA